MHGNLLETDALAIISDNIGPELVELGVRGQQAESELAAVFSGFVKREPKEIFGDAQSFLRNSRFLQRVKVGLKRVSRGRLE